MKRIPREEALRKLFLDRTRYRPIRLDDADAREGSRVAGAAPLCFTDAPPKCPRCERPLEYFLTLEADLVGPDVAKGRALSIFACADADCRLESRSLDAEPPSVVAITHDPSPRSEGDPGARLVRGHLRREELTEGVGDSSEEQSKLGGLVFHIQTSIGLDEIEAARRGLTFLLQINEQDLDDHTTKAGFWGGEVYLFTSKDPETGLPTLERGRVSWSYT